MRDMETTALRDKRWFALPEQMRDAFVARLVDALPGGVDRDAAVARLRVQQRRERSPDTYQQSTVRSMMDLGGRQQLDAIQMVVDAMMRVGPDGFAGTIGATAEELGISKRTLFRMIGDYPPLRDAVNKARGADLTDDSE